MPEPTPAQVEELVEVCRGVLWLGLNSHNIKEDPEGFRRYLAALVKDTRQALAPFEQSRADQEGGGASP